MENDNSNKKKITFMIIGLVILLILVIGSTYAYFSVDVNDSNSKPTKVTANTDKVGTATLKTITSTLKLILSGNEMSQNNIGTYYGDDEQNFVNNENDGTHTFAQVAMENGEDDTKYSCSADIKITTNTDLENSMASVLETGDLILNLIGYKQLDLSGLKTNGSLTTKIKFKLTGNSTLDIKGYLKLENKDTLQEYLAGKILNIDLITENLQCSIDTGTTSSQTASEYIYAQSPKGLSDSDVGGMRRFQGTNDQVDNYLCFGSKCNNLSNDMYRIIGVTSDGLIKVIKQMSIGTKEWWTDWREDKNWLESNLYKYLNTDEGNFYDTLDETIKGKIENHYWKYGDITMGESEFQSGDMYNEFWKVESNWNETIQAHIGLMYLSDYMYSVGEEIFNKWIKNPNFDTSSWMHMANNGVLMDEYSADSYEWTMSRYDYGSYYGAWHVILDGSVGPNTLNFTFAVRPVFYIQSSATITEGDGTSDNPFIIDD